MKKVFLSLLFIFIFITIAESYDNTVVHKVINTNAAKQSNNLLKFLVELGFESGLESSVNGQKIYKWIEDGGKAEDEPVTRTLNHFYDPTKAGDVAGLNDSITILGIPIITFKGESSVLWMQRPDQSDGGTWSWPKARQCYYLGLISDTKEKREQSLADTFKALGHIMHLVSDVAVPAHVRNDAHPEGDLYETYTEQANTFQYGGYETVTLPKLTDYWDDEQGKGLAEFTNANFFSKDRNKDNKNYANPKVFAESQEFLQEVTDADGNKEIVKVRYGLGTVNDSYTNASYADVKLTAYSLWDFDYNVKMNENVYFLNDTIHQTYADFLVPRAVGYSAGLLNYFFRGDINMIPDGESGSGYVIINNTDEDMNGTFELWYDNKNDERLKVPSASWTLSINKKDPNNSNANKSTNITFTPPTDMKEENKYLLVFQGKLGNEQGAVVGKNVVVGKPIPAIVHATRGYDGYGFYIGYGLEVNIGDKQYTRAIYDDVVKTGERVVIKAVRFAEENPYIILLLSLHEQLPSGTGTYKVHKFTVNNDGIAYGGIVKELPYYKEEFPRTQDVKTYENKYENSCMSQELKTDITFMIETSARTTYNYQDLYASRDGIPTVFGTLTRYKEGIGYSSEITYQNIRKEWCYNGTPACPWTETSNTKFIYEIPSDPGIIYRQFDSYCDQEEFYGEAYDVYLMPGSCSVVKQTTWCDTYGRQYSSSYDGICGRTYNGKYYCGARGSQYKVIIDDIEGDEIGEGYTEIVALSASSYGLLTIDGKVKLPDKTVSLDHGYNTNDRNIISHSMIFPMGYSIAVSELDKPREWYGSKIIKSITITPAEEFSCGTVSIFTNDKKDCFIISYGNYGDAQNYSTDCNSRCQTLSSGQSWYSTHRVFDITFYKKR